MTNEEKAREIAENNKCDYPFKGGLINTSKAECEDSALEMAEWKDAQFKEYLEDRLDSVRNCCVVSRSDDFYEGMIEMLEEIINELFESNMEKTRVKKGEEYWLIDKDGEICWRYDGYSCQDDIMFYYGNYFHTKEEAESMARKLSAVLKGADVIDMPSEEDAYNEEFKTNPYLFSEDGAAVVGSHQSGFNHCFEWLKSKIIK